MPTSKKHHTTEETDATKGTEHEQILAMLKSIDQRLSILEKSPLQDGARVVSQGAKVVADTAKEVFDRVEARKWFDKSYETAAGACDTLGQQFKTWWESRGGSSVTSDDVKKDENVVEGEVIPKDERKHKTNS